jgi:hypothetical protein
MLARIFIAVLLILTTVATYTQTHQGFIYPYYSKQLKCLKSETASAQTYALQNKKIQLK